MKKLISEPFQQINTVDRRFHGSMLDVETPGGNGSACALLHEDGRAAERVKVGAEGH